MSNKIKLFIFCYMPVFNSLLLRESNDGVIFWTKPHHLGVTVSSWFFKLYVNLRLLETIKQRKLS